MYTDDMSSVSGRRLENVVHHLFDQLKSVFVRLPCTLHYLNIYEYYCFTAMYVYMHCYFAGIFLFLWYSGMRVTSKSRTWSTGAKHLVQCIMLSCASFFSGTGFLLGVEHGSVQHRKLECTWPKLCALIGPLHFRLASFILFVVSHVYCAISFYQ